VILPDNGHKKSGVSACVCVRAQRQALFVCSVKLRAPSGWSGYFLDTVK